MPASFCAISSFRALKEEIAQKEAGILFLDGVLSNPEIYYRKAFNTKK